MMQRGIPFAKSHGLRNDYVIVEAADVPPGDAAGLAVRICDRQSGVGADGLIVLEHRDDSPTLFSIINADGSTAELCGNGLRCAALHRANHQPASIVLESAVGVHRAQVRQDSEGRWHVDMNLVAARPEPPLVLELDGVPTEVHIVQLGNPHAILLSQVSSDVQVLPQLVGAVSNTGRFPDGINVHLGLLRGHGMMLHSWERGVGHVQACATGAAAAASALGPGCCAVDMPGGRLLITVPDDGGDIRMDGPAEMICTGVYHDCGVGE